jgi:putative transposase
MDYQRDEHRVHLIAYHLVWTPKRRKAVLTGEVANDCRSVIEAKCQERGWRMVELAVQPDHIHLFVVAWPTTTAAEIVKECKGVRSYELRRKHKQLLRLPSLWTRSYFAATVGNVSQSVIEAYLAAQKGL